MISRKGTFQYQRNVSPNSRRSRKMIASELEFLKANRRYSELVAKVWQASDDGCDLLGTKELGEKLRKG
jgi:hypothetical protein